MCGLFKKKDKGKSQESEPPLPDDLPPMPDDLGAMDRPFEGMPPNGQDMPPIPEPDNSDFPDMPSDMPMDVHDQIPNDIALGPPPMEPPELHPENLPKLDEPNPDSIPSDVKARDLPPLPEIPETKPVDERPPMPGVDDDVPVPPAIFSEDGFYDTPNEIQQLVEKRGPAEPEPYREDYKTKYRLDEVEVPEEEIEDSPPVRKYKTEGPIFVDIDAFRTLLNDLDGIRNDIKSSSDILQHLSEIKNSKDDEFEKWRLALEDLQKKIVYVDKIIYKEA